MALSRVIRELITEAVTIDERGEVKRFTDLPTWIPEGKYVALVKGAVVAVCDTVSDAALEAIRKFRDEPFSIVRKGGSIRKIDYAFFAEEMLKCWAFSGVGESLFPIVPAVLVGRRMAEVSALPDSAASISLAKRSIIGESKLVEVGTEEVSSIGGSVRRRVYEGEIQLGTGSYKARVAEAIIPDDLPFQLLIGRNVLDHLDTYLLGKRSVVCIKDP